jgi:competence/damage-inducible protein CinA-like protein
MRAEIIAIGSELVLGTTVDTNTSYLARQLAAVGVDITRTHMVGDSLSHITSLVREALERADLVICTGGLGPTEDDVTREAVARALDRPLEFRQELLDTIAARFAAMNRPMSESNQTQAYVPQGARAIANQYGTAPAFLVELPRSVLIVLPGVPMEMRALFEEHIHPYLRNERGIEGTVHVQKMHIVGLGESVIGERIADLMRTENPTVGTSAKQGQCELRIAAKAPTVDEAKELIAPVEAAIKERLGNFCIGFEPLDRLVARQLQESGITLALYEGGAIAPVYRMLSLVPNGLSAVRGAMLYPYAVEYPRIADMSAEGAMEVRDRWQPDIGLGIQVAEPNPETGFSAVCVTLAIYNGRNQVIRHFDLRQSEKWDYIANFALEMVYGYVRAHIAR